MAFNNDDLIKMIKQKAFVPSSQITFTDDELLDLATNELYDTILPMVLSTREEFYGTSKDYAVTAGSPVDIPSRAIGLAVREITFISGNSEINMPRYDLEDIPNQQQFSGTSYGFYLQGNQIKFLSQINGTVRVYFHIRPGQLVRSSKAATVVSINTNTNTIQLNQQISGWSTSTKLDVIKGQPGFDTLDSDISPASVSGTSMSFTTLPSRLAIGDWICAAEQSAVTQIPVEFRSYLAQLVAVQILESLGDLEAKNSAQSKLEAMRDAALSMITPRVVGESKKLVNFYNRASTTYRGY